MVSLSGRCDFDIVYKLTLRVVVDAVMLYPGKLCAEKIIYAFASSEKSLDV